MKKIDPSQHDQHVDADERPFLEHILELRQRILKAVLTVLLLFFPLYYFLANDIYSWVAAPLMANLPTGSTMIATEVASPFVTPFKLSMYAALFWRCLILHQAGFHFARSLSARKALCHAVARFEHLLYYLGMMFAYYLCFRSRSVFRSVTPAGVTMMTDINKYLDFAIGLFLASGSHSKFQSPRSWSSRPASRRKISCEATLRDCWVFRRRCRADPTRCDIAGHARRADVGVVRTRRIVHAPRRCFRRCGAGRQSNRNVTGPSFTRLTFISAPNRPVATRPTRARTR